MKRLLLPAVLLLSSAAWADIAPPDTSGCRGKKASVACQTDDGQPGLCQRVKGSRLDYSQGVPPKSVAYEFLQCVATATAPAEKAAPAPQGQTSTRGFGATPGVALTLGAILAAWFTRGKRRTA
jgi:hypothetical protein